MDAHPTDFDPSLLSEHSEWIRTLARSLVRDPGTADDIAQETWVAALRQPPDAARPARPWLASVARNAARQVIRARDRRTQRERHAARAEALPSDEELAEKAALQQWVADKVMTLDEPYRRTVLLRYFEGLPPRDIASRMGVPREAVKSRLQRALAQLRERLDARDGPGGASGVLALSPLVSTIHWSATGGAGFALMGKKGLLAIGILLTLIASAVLHAVLREPGGTPEVVGLVERIDAGDAEEAGLSAAPEIDDVASVATGGADERTAMPTAGGVQLITVRRDSGLPVADVQVWIAPSLSVLEGQRWGGRGQSVDVETIIRAVGTSIATDSQGSALVPNLEQYSIAVARHGEMYGQAYFLPRDGATVEIPLGIDRSITIQTVTEAGDPIAGIPVGLAEFRAGANGSIFWWAATTGKTGQVTIHHIDHTLDNEIKPGVQWTVTLAAPWPDLAGANLNPHDLPDAPIQLMVNRGGRVVVRLEGDAGEPILSEEWVFLREAGADHDSLGRFARPRRHDRLVRDGVAVFENVAPGLELLASVRPLDRREASAVFAGPEAVGEERTVHLRVGEKYPSISGVAVDSEGIPLAHRGLDARGFARDDRGGNYEVSSRLRTDGEGHFDAPLRTSQPGDLIREVHLTTDEQFEGESLLAQVPLDPHRAAGDANLGRVMLEPPPLILSGRVVDSEGEPVYWAGIWVKRMTGSNGSGGASYKWVHAWQTNTQKDGTFKLTGDQGAGDFRLRVAIDGYLEQADIPFQPGMRDLEIVLQKVGAIKGSLKLPQRVPPGWLRVTAKPKEAYRAFGSSARRPKPDGSFFLPDIAPGTVDVTVFLPAWNKPLVRIANVRVDSDEARSDPRLVNLDLTGAIHRIDLDVRDVDGIAVPIGSVSYSHPDGSQTHMAFDEGTASLLSPTPTLAVEILAPGFKPQRIEGARDGLRVVLERGFPLRVKLPDGYDVPESPVTLTLLLLPTDRSALESDAVVYTDDGSPSDTWSRRQYGVTAKMIDSDELILFVGSPGTWQIGWSLSGERWSGGVRSADGSPSTVEVAESDSLRVIELAPDADAIERSIAEHN